MEGDEGDLGQDKGRQDPILEAMISSQLKPDCYDTKQVNVDATINSYNEKGLQYLLVLLQLTKKSVTAGF